MAGRGGGGVGGWLVNSSVKYFQRLCNVSDTVRN